MRPLIHAFLPALILFFSACSETPDETMKRLNDAHNLGKTEEVLIETDDLLRELEEDFSEVIYDGKTDTLPARTYDGSTAAWMAGDDLYFYTDSLQSVDTGVEGAFLGLSFDGSHAAVMDSDCTIEIASLVTKEILFERRFPHCPGIPAADKNGTLYMGTEEGIVKIPAGTEDSPPEIIITRKEFQEKYKKIANSFHLFDGPDSSLIIFYGNAGYYRLYIFRETEGLKFIGDNFVKPELYFIQESDLLDQAVAEEKNLLEDYNALILHGSSGKYRLKAVRFRSKSLKKISIPYLIRRPSGFESSGKIYYTEDDELISYHPGRKIRETLPFPADFAVSVRGGFLYRDRNGEFRIRKKALSSFEKDLFILRETASKEKMKDEKDAFQ